MNLDAVRPHWAQRAAFAVVSVLSVGLAVSTPGAFYASSPLPWVPLLLTVVVSLHTVHLLTLELELDDDGVTLTSLLQSRFVTWRDSAYVLWNDVAPLRTHSSRVLEATVLLTGLYLVGWSYGAPPGYELTGLLSTVSVAAGVATLVEASLARADRLAATRPPVTSQFVLSDDAGRLLLVPRTFADADVDRLREVFQARREPALRRIRREGERETGDSS